MTKSILYPFFLFLLVLVVDQPVNLTMVRNPGRPEATEHELTTTYVQGVLSQLKAERGQKTVLMVGSSRSMFLKALDAEFIAQDPLVSPEEREALKEWTFNITGAFPGANLLVQLVVLDALIASGYKPELLVIETAPEFMNQAYIESEYNKNIYDADFLIRHGSVLPRSMKVDAVVRLLFPSYRYKFRIEKALGEGFQDNFEFRRQFMSSVLSNRTAFKSDGKTVVDHSQHAVLTAEQDKAFHAQLREVVKLSKLPRKRQLDAMTLHTLTMAEKAGIRTVLWMPAVNDYVAKTLYADREEVEAFNRLVKSTGIPVVRGNDYLDRCDRWEDSVHLSRRCNGIVGAAFLRASQYSKIGK